MEFSRLDVFMARVRLEKTTKSLDPVKAEAAKKVLADKELFFRFVKASVEKKERKEVDMKMSA